MRIISVKPILFLLLFAALACTENSVPKPRGYFRISFPAKHYRLFDTIYPFAFEYPVYGKIVKEEKLQDEGEWISVSFPAYKAKIHLSYKDISGNLSQLTEDARNLAYKHTYKADAIDEQVFTNPQKKVYGILYDIKGNSASSVQFYVTDSSRHYLRGALYFRCQPNKDSLAPAIDFFKADVIHLIETLGWK
ncbi:MAG TPA: gliding motility lipoprotein GldD [Bacteroidales bacterium]|nr:gliding motility lipoprotein GldD [Bacteroidales bacterium]